MPNMAILVTKKFNDWNRTLDFFPSFGAKRKLLYQVKDTKAYLDRNVLSIVQQQVMLKVFVIELKQWKISIVKQKFMSYANFIIPVRINAETKPFSDNASVMLAFITIVSITIQKYVYWHALVPYTYLYLLAKIWFGDKRRSPKTHM